jgi:oligopeptidase A
MVSRHGVFSCPRERLAHSPTSDYNSEMNKNTQTDSETQPSNPLLHRTSIIPFDSFKAEQIEPAIEALLASSTAELDAIKAAPGERTFENTLRALDNLALDLNFAMGIISHLESIATHPEWRDAYNKVLPRVSEFSSKIVLDPDLWRALQGFAASNEAQALIGEKRRFMTKTVEDFRRNGADLPPEKKELLSKINTELAEVTNRFGQHTLDATNAFEHVTESESDLAGLPESARAMGRGSAQSKGLPGWRFTLQAPSFMAIMTYADNRAIREKFFRAHNTRCTSGEFDNVPLLYRILELRRQKAELLGFKDFSDLVLADRMAKGGERAHAFVDELRSRIARHVESEHKALLGFVREELKVDPNDVAPWDMAYYAEKMRRAHYEFDEEELRPYFPLPKVMQGLFTIVEKTFGITVRENAQLPKWCPETTTYSAYETKTGELMGHFYSDLFPRENKRGGAWMNGFITHIFDGKDNLPHVGLIAGNFTPPQEGKPSLFTHDEVTTLFHEFGHLMHLLCSRTELRSQSMDGVAWDFIELPSQILENWCWDRGALDLFAAHVETGERLPEDLFQKMYRARNFRSGSFLMRQVGFSTVDLALHRSYNRENDGEILGYCRRILEQHSPLPLPEYYGMIAAFTHLFSSPVAYAAGYYSYQWAEVLDADAFSRFQREGVMNLQTGLEFRDKVLSRGDTKDPEVLFRDFMGREPEMNALLTRAGLV